MSHELKIILGTSPQSTVVLVDNEPVGLIQNVTININAYSQESHIEITLPNLFSRNIDSSYMDKTAFTGPLQGQLQKTFNLLREIPQVKIILSDPFEKD